MNGNSFDLFGNFAMIRLYFEYRTMPINAAASDALYSVKFKAVSVQHFSDFFYGDAVDFRNFNAALYALPVHVVPIGIIQADVRGWRVEPKRVPCHLEHAKNGQTHLEQPDERSFIHKCRVNLLEKKARPSRAGGSGHPVAGGKNPTNRPFVLR
jgi:hypothetical protein